MVSALASFVSSPLGIASKLSLLSLIENVLKSAISRQAKASKLSLVFWLIENVDFIFVSSPSQSEQALFGLLAYRKRLYKHRRIGMASESDGSVMLKGAYNAIGGLVLGLSAQRDIRQKAMPLS